MVTPRFSVVIPTRDRAETLRVSLRTCLEQDFSDYEILVCDNDGAPAVRRVVEEAASPRIRYLRSPRLLSMSANWELAVSQARGEYVLVLGDDDGLMPYALHELDKIIAGRWAEAIRWTAAYYTWPTIDLPGQADYLRVPLGRGARTVDGVAAIAAVIRFEQCYTTLPMLYNAAVHRGLIGRLRERAGRVFGNHYPDVYTGFALAHLSGEYLSLDTPLTVAGTSGGSFGVANLFRRGKSPRDHEFRALNAAERLPTHPWVPDLAIFPYVPVADSFLLAKEALFPDSDLRLDRRAFVACCVEGARADDEAAWRAALAEIRRTLEDDPASQAWFDATLANRPYHPLPPVQLRGARLGWDGASLHLDAAAFGVKDVRGAVQLCEKILNYGRESILHEERSGTSEEEAGAIRELRAAADERLELIHRLTGTAEERLALIQKLDAEAKRQARAAEERLDVVRRLEAEVKRLEVERAAPRAPGLSRFLGRLFATGRRGSGPRSAAG
jgi:glycosyltransferase involved in cell wall biosynthesis